MTFLLADLLIEKMYMNNLHHLQVLRTPIGSFRIFFMSIPKIPLYKIYNHNLP